jgi:3-oxoacyl-ACP reductase-like protein
VVVVVGAVDCVVEAPVLVEPDDAAPALEMPANAPPVASAPATIVAPSSFDVFMRSNLLG